ncbi:hypothetical protein BJI67_14705 [Acidihalobacter aeolianus]|uniref:Cbb3-type cytochrome c oxidase subunit 3 n=1 Tax=Acidihalobacter aeolianus TaxID=2792603 RepID=A0A1D8KCJ7_9GAMM|nr:cbb3-type cytochrome c oxidase subunit 3 [Acidihalobacter aeolianus]AOV18666.1 hypothetical protein BJI67_14705 [Acidihalobacter aeolianus]
MAEIWQSLVELASHKTTLLALLFPLFVGIVIYTYTNKRRSARLETYRYMPFEDEKGAQEDGQEKRSRRGGDDGRT